MELFHRTLSWLLEQYPEGFRAIESHPARLHQLVLLCHHEPWVSLWEYLIAYARSKENKAFVSRSSLPHDQGRPDDLRYAVSQNRGKRLGSCDAQLEVVYRALLNHGLTPPPTALSTSPPYHLIYCLSKLKDRLELTSRTINDEYNPAFHCLIEDKDICVADLDAWLSSTGNTAPGNYPANLLLESTMFLLRRIFAELSQRYDTKYRDIVLINQSIVKQRLLLLHRVTELAARRQLEPSESYKIHVSNYIQSHNQDLGPIDPLDSISSTKKQAIDSLRRLKTSLREARSILQVRSPDTSTNSVWTRQEELLRLDSIIHAIKSVKNPNTSSPFSSHDAILKQCEQRLARSLHKHRAIKDRIDQIQVLERAIQAQKEQMNQ